MERKRNSKGQFLKGNKESPGRMRGGKNKSTEIFEAIALSVWKRRLRYLMKSSRPRTWMRSSWCLSILGLGSGQFNPPTKISNYQKAVAYYVKILQGTAKGILPPSEGSKTARVPLRAEVVRPNECWSMDFIICQVLSEMATGSSC